jgi:tetratricopeptide (TPR) repeat protein
MIGPLVLAVDFANFTYRTNPCAQNVPVPVVMRRGSFSYFDHKMGAGFDLGVRSVKKGSLEAGTRQAVVVIACDFPVGGTAAAYVFDERGTTAVPLGKVASADWGGDWGNGPDSIGVRFAKHRLFVDQCVGNQCASRRSATFALRGGKLVAVSDVTREVHDARFFMNRAVAAKGNRDYAGAIANYTAAIRLNPHGPYGYSGRAEIYVDQKDYDRAIDDYTQAIRLRPDDPSALIGRGDVYEKLRAYDRAVADYTAAIRAEDRIVRDPHDIERAYYLYVRGGAYELASDLDRAIADFSEAIVIDPRDARYHNARCWDRALAGADLQGALADCNDALRLKPNDPASLDSRALTYLKLGRLDDAIADTNAVLGREPKTATSLLVRGLAKRRKGDIASGNADIAAAKELQPGVDAEFARYGVK